LIGVGFLATWAMISNLTAHLFLTVWRPFRLGQVVSLLPEDLKGRVVDRTMMFTVLREESGATLMIPNNLFFQKIFRVDENRENRTDAAVSNTYAGDCQLGRANETRPPIT
jgi:small-conductance mechanosensitive channel